LCPRDNCKLCRPYHLHFVEVCYSTDYKLEDAQMRKILKYDPPKDATLVVMACPVGPYFPGGARAIDLLLDEAHVRAWPGGSGGALKPN